MSRIEQAWCRSVPWRTFTRRVVLPWAIGAADLRGDVLELGSGSGVMAVELLNRYPAIRLIASDVDPAMLAAATNRLDRFETRVEVTEADATALPFGDASFDAVVSFIMLHHVIDWEQALGEVARVLRPGGVLAGYDLVDAGANRLINRFGRSTSRMATAPALRTRLAELPFHEVIVTKGVAGHVARFRARRADDTTSTAGTTNEAGRTP